MAIEVKLDDRLAQVELISQEGNQVTIVVDDQQYEIDLMQVERGVYSVLYKGRSYNVELIETESAKKYAINTFYHSYAADIIDAEAKYRLARKAGQLAEEESTIKSPMPGKVVKVMAKVGDKVEKGQTLVIVAAMKMESEYKAMRDGVVAEVFVKNDDTVDSNQPLIVID